MNIIKRFGSFWYHFIVGDDWRIALGVIMGLGITAYLTHTHRLNTWWMIPVLVITLLSLSLRAGTRKSDT